MLAKSFIILGIVFIVIGIFLYFGDKLPFNIGHLPGDISIKKENFSFYFPITSSIILSIILSVLFYFFMKFK